MNVDYGSLISEVGKLISERGKNYGEPLANMQDTADLFNVYLKGKDRIEAGDVLPAIGAVPISGEYLSPWLTPAVDDTPPTLSVVRNADGTVTMTFEGTLQTAPTVNGPWTDVNGASPLTVPADQAAAFGRAKK